MLVRLSEELLASAFRMLREVLDRTKATITGRARIEYEATAGTAETVRQAAGTLGGIDHDLARPLSAHTLSTSVEHPGPPRADPSGDGLASDSSDPDPELTDRFYRDFGIGSGADRPGQLPVMLRGCTALQQLKDRYGDAITFHGSHLSLTRLEPRQATWGMHPPVPDGDPAICVDEDYVIPTFMSLYKRLGEQGVMHGYYTDSAREIHYFVDGIDDGAIDVDSLVGYVHVLPRKAFTEISLPVPEGFDGPGKDYQRNPELRAFQPLKPLAIVEVTHPDFPKPLQSHPPS